MQKIFIVKQDPESKNEEGNFYEVNEFIKNGGHIISVTAQHVHSGVQSTFSSRGRWLVVADDKPKTEEELLP